MIMIIVTIFLSHVSSSTSLSRKHPRNAQVTFTEALGTMSKNNLRWLKLVSTYSSDLFIRRIDTTTLYHITEMLWYHVKHQLLLNKMQSFFWCSKLPWQQENLAKTQYIWLKLLISEKRTGWSQFFIAQKWSAGQDETLQSLRKFYGVDAEIL